MNDGVYRQSIKLVKTIALYPKITLKIAYFTHQFLPRHVGGTEIYTHGLATRAQRAGHSVHVITYVESASLEARDYQTIQTEHQGIPVTEIHFNLSRAANPARAEYDNPHIVERLRNELEKIRPDIVHALHAMKLSGAALGLCYEMKLPVVLTLADYWFVCPRHTLIRWNKELCEGPRHDLDCLRCLHDLHGFAGGAAQKLPAPLLRAASKLSSTFFDKRQSRFWRDLDAIRKRNNYLRDIAERADCVIALSDFQKEMFVRNGYPSEKIHVIHHGLETGGLRPASNEAKEFYEIIFIGSLVYHKGPHIPIKALALHPELKIRLRLYGDASGSDAYLDLLKELAAADERVELMGTFPPGEMGSALETADALVMPALWYENEPLVVKAAQYVGLPILASNIGTLATSIRDGVNGWLLPPGDAEAWGRAFAAFAPKPLTPDPSIKSMDENARELLSLYEDICLRRCSAQNT